MSPLSTKRMTESDAAGRSKDFPLGESREAADRKDIARLSFTQLSHMSRGELEHVVRASPPPGEPVQPEYLDDGTLRRLAHLARLSCRNRGD